MVFKFSPGDLIIDKRLADPDLEIVLSCDDKYVYFYDLNNSSGIRYYGDLRNYCLARKYEQLRLF